MTSIDQRKEFQKTASIKPRKLLPILMRVKYLIITFLCALSTISFVAVDDIVQSKNTIWHNGDIVFQDSESSQSKAIKLATNSKFSHCGIVFEQGGNWMVLEAVQPVRIIPLNQWIAQGTNSKYTVKRLKDQSALTDSVLNEMQKVGTGFVGKNYDILFGWGDDKLYCSELVWKIYKRGAGLEVGTRKPLKSYNLNHPTVRKQLELRYGKSIPMDDVMVSPQDIYESPLLE
jgi:hypothetical protein